MFTWEDIFNMLRNLGSEYFFSENEKNAEEEDY